MAGIKFAAEHWWDGNARLTVTHSRFWQTSEMINEYKKNGEFSYQDDTLSSKVCWLRQNKTISLDGFIYRELGDGGFGEHAVPAPGFLLGR